MRHERIRSVGAVGCAMDKVVSCWPVTMEAQVHVWVNPCEIFGRQNGTKTTFSSSYLLFRYQYHSTMAPHFPYSYIIWGMNNRHVGGHSSEI
jgi:hypothetical protein